MRLVKLLLATYVIGFSTLSFAQGVTLAARSVADSCRFIYRIETDVELVAPGSDQVAVWLKDLYTDTFLAPEFYPVEAGKARFTAVSMSQNPKYLAHDL